MPYKLIAGLGCVIVLGVLVLAACSNVKEISSTNVVPDGEFVYLHVNFAGGGFLSKDKMIIKVNDKKLRFMDGDFTQVTEFSGSDSTIINNWMVKGENLIEVEIDHNNADPSTSRDPLIFSLKIESVSKNGIASTHGGEPGLFFADKTVKKEDFKDPLILRGRFIY